MPLWNVRTLVVEDRRVMARLVADLLDRLGFDMIDHAKDGTAALAKLRAEKYGLVIAEAETAPMSGLQLLRAVRADDHLKRIPFLVTTASTEIEKIVATRNAGANSVLLKPFAAQALEAKISEAFERAGPAPANAAWGPRKAAPGWNRLAAFRQM